MKRVTVEAMFPELKGAGIYATGRGTGSNAKAAISRAFGDLFKQKQVRGRKIHVVKATISIMEAATEMVPTQFKEVGRL